MTGGNVTLSGGAGADTFAFNYDTTSSGSVAAIIQDFDPSEDKIVVNYTGTGTASLASATSGDDLIWRDTVNGGFRVTLKSARENDYFDGNASDEAWDVLALTNAEREAQGLSPLTMSDGLMTGASVRAQEITTVFEHTRPDGTNCFTALEKSYWDSGENIAAGQNSPASVVTAWMNSPGHRANILNSDYQKLGVGYIYDNSSDYRYYWVQMFGSTLYSPAPTIISAADMAAATIEVNTSASASKLITLTSGNDTYSNTVSGATISALGGNDTVKNTGSKVSISGGAGVDSINNSGTKVTILGGDDNDKIINSGSSAKINAGAGNDSIKNTAASVSIVGGAGKDSITNTKTKVTINAGADNDRIVNSAASVSIIAGAGNDLVSIGANAKSNVITYTAGNDTIKGFNATSTLKLGNGSATYTKTIDDDNIILTIGDGSVTLTGAASLTKPKILGEEIITTVNFTDNDAAKQTLDAQIITADASARTKAIRITGNALANSILGGSGKDSLYGGAGADYLAGGKGNDKLYGQAGDDYLEGGAGNDLLSGYTGDDTLWGGVGNDTLTGGAGADVFIYASGEGNDVITDFANNDMLQITGTFSATYNKSANTIAFKVGSTANAITLQDFTATTFSINSFNYKISGTKLVKK